MVAALATSDSERGYPPSIGTDALRRRDPGWIGRRFGVDVDARSGRRVRRHEGVRRRRCRSGCKLRTPARDTVLYPAVAYPTYEMGAILAGCRPVPVPPTPDGGLDLGAIDAADAARALLLWVNSPSNPTGALDDLGAAAAWGRAHGVPVFSDECYVEFTWDGPARTILEHGLDGVVAVHSLSKRSNLAGLRVGFYAGDARDRRLPARGPQARRDDGARAGAGGRGRSRSPTTSTSSSSATATGAGWSRWRRSLSRWSGIDIAACRPAGSTCGSTPATGGRSPSASPRRAARWSAPATSTAQVVRRTSASPWYNLTIEWRSSPSDWG